MRSCAHLRPNSLGQPSESCGPGGAGTRTLEGGGGQEEQPVSRWAGPSWEPTPALFSRAPTVFQRTHWMEAGWAPTQASGHTGPPDSPGHPVPQQALPHRKVPTAEHSQAPASLGSATPPRSKALALAPTVTAQGNLRGQQTPGPKCRHWAQAPRGASVTGHLCVPASKGGPPNLWSIPAKVPGLSLPSGSCLTQGRSEV